MSGLFGIELDNPTGNTVVVDLFELGGSDSTKIYNGVTAKENVGFVGGWYNQNFIFWNPTGANEIAIFQGLQANANIWFEVNSKNIFFYQQYTSPAPIGNPPATGYKKIEYSDGIQQSIAVGIPNNYTLLDFTKDVKVAFENKVGESNCINVISKVEVMRDSNLDNFIRVRFEINYLRSDGYISETSTFTPIRNISWRYDSPIGVGVTTFPFPINSSEHNLLGSFSWLQSFTTIDGISVKGTTGDNYGQLLRGQSSEPMAINSMRVTPLSSSTFDESNRISQLLQPMKFTRVNSNGLSDSYVLSPTVDLYQATTTLDYINLGTRTDDFPFDGNTRFSYELLPFASVSLQFDYIQISNFIFANRELVKEIVARNKQRNKEVEYLSSISREYKLKLK